MPAQGRPSKMVYGKNDLAKVATLATIARTRCERFIEFDVEASCANPLEKGVQLWGDVIAERRSPIGAIVRVKVTPAAIIEEYRRQLVNCGEAPRLEPEKELATNR